MRIGIDACCWSNRRGFGRFTRELVTHMITEFPCHEFTLIADHQTVAGGDFPSAARLVPVKTGQQATQAASAEGARSIVDLWRMSRAVTRLPLDVFFFPAVYSFFPMLRRIPTVVTFHDAIAENFPGLIFPNRRSRLFWSLKTWLARRQASHFLTVSESARDQIEKTFHIPSSSITVIPEGADKAFHPLEDVQGHEELRRKYSLPFDKPLIMYVGGISPHKNLHGLFNALAILRDSGNTEWHAVLVGDYNNDSFFGCYQELLTQSRTLNLDAQITFTGYVSNEDLVVLMNNASFLILPSFSEGFGLPVVEAMSCGLPVTVSSRGSLPELVGDAGMLFNPDQPTSIADAIRQMLSDSALRNRLRTAGLLRAQQYSWREAACKTVKLLEALDLGSRKAS